MTDAEPITCWQCERRTVLCLKDTDAEWLTCEWCDANLEKAVDAFAQLRKSQHERIEQALGVPDFLDRKRRNQ